MFLFPLSNNDEFTITWADIAVGASAGMLMCLGRIFVTIGVAIGEAGPAEALMSTHALYQSLLSAIFAGQTLSALEICGVLLGLGGVSVESSAWHSSTLLSTNIGRRRRSRD